MLQNHPQRVLITGISKGIGRALALRFAREGFAIMGCARGQSGLEALAAEIAQLAPGASLNLVQADLAQPEAVRDFARQAFEWCSAPDILIHNAGIFRPGSVLEDAEGQLEELMHINVFSAYHLSRKLVPGMVARGSGHIFTLCSVASLQAYPGGASYAITKFALLGLTRSLRAELKSSGVKVTALLPGATWSDSWQGVDFPRERLMEPEDLAELVWTASRLGPAAVVEELLIRPQLGDL